MIKQSLIPSKVFGPGQHYGSPLESQHGPIPEKPADVHYECVDCQDLYNRLVVIFKSMGHDF